MRFKKTIVIMLLSTCLLSSCSTINEKIIQIDSNLTLLNEGKEFECPFEYNEKNELIYYVNTLKQYKLAINPVSNKSKNAYFTGDKIAFDDCYGACENDDGVYYTKYAEFYYISVENEQPVYKVCFRRRGTYDLNFSYNGIKSKIKIVCDNESNKYDKYRYDISKAFPWMKDLKFNDIKKVRFENGHNGIAPGSFNEIFYSSNKDDIINCFNYILSKIMIVETNEYQVDGGGYESITFYDELNSYDLKIASGFIYGDDCVYHIEKIPGSTKINNPYVNAFSFVTYGEDNCDVYKVEKENEVAKTIDYLDELEFTERGNEIAENTEPEFFIDDCLKVKSRLYIYEANRFKYLDKFYKIIGDINFSNLFLD